MRKPFLKPSLKISLAYFLVSLAWIFFSDKLLMVLSKHDPINRILHIQTFKGIFFISTTAFLLYFFIEAHYKRLQRSARDYMQLFLQNPNPMWIYDMETFRFLAVNNAAVSRYGYTAEEFAAMTILDIRPPEEVAALKDHIRHLEPGFNDSGYWKHLTRNGNIIYVNILSYTILYQGKRAELITVWDVTEKYLAEETIRLNEKKLNTLINSTRDTIWSVDAHFRITAMNERFRRLAEQMTGRSYKIGDVVVDEADTEMNREWRSYYNRAFSGECFSVDRTLHLPAFGAITMEVTFNPITDHQQNTVGVVCFSHNITERRSYISQIEKQNTLFKEIAWIISHEVRRPVASILGLTSLFNDQTNLSEGENRQIIYYLKTSVLELDRMISKVMEKVNDIYNSHK